MKKILIGAFLLVSSLTFADGGLDFLEDRLESKYKTITDKTNNKIIIDEIDVDYFNGKPYVKLEIESLAGDGGWSKFDKASYEDIAKQIANEVRSALNTNEPVEINVILDKEFGRDELLNTANF